MQIINFDQILQSRRFLPLIHKDSVIEQLVFEITRHLDKDPDAVYSFDFSGQTGTPDSRKVRYIRAVCYRQLKRLYGLADWSPPQNPSLKYVKNTLNSVS